MSVREDRTEKPRPGGDPRLRSSSPHTAGLQAWKKPDAIHHGADSSLLATIQPVSPSVLECCLKGCICCHVLLPQCSLPSSFPDKAVKNIWVSSFLPARRRAGVPGVGTREQTAADTSSLHCTGSWGMRTAPYTFPYTETTYSLQVASTAWMKEEKSSSGCECYAEYLHRLQEESRRSFHGSLPWAAFTIHGVNLGALCKHDLVKHLNTHHM